MGGSSEIFTGQAANTCFVSNRAAAILCEAAKATRQRPRTEGAVHLCRAVQGVGPALLTHDHFFIHTNAIRARVPIFEANSHIHAPTEVALMGDKSPKSTQKRTNQKQTKTNRVKQKKRDLENSKRALSSKK